VTSLRDREADASGGAAGPHPAGRVGVIGAGQMGSGIAAVLVRAGLPTALVDVSASMLEAGTKAVYKVAADSPGLLATSTSLSALASCDVVIEAVTEDEAIKTATFGALAGILPEGAIVGSNTSTIPISRMAASTARPDRFAGMHFFHPAHRMELVEVIRGRQTGDETLATLEALARRLGKTPIIVKDCPGFLVTRVLYPYLSQALRLLQEGVSMDAIDAAATRFGMPTGPIALFDFIGLDTALAIAQVMAEGYPDRAAPSPLLAEMVAAGRLGRKSGAGFRSHARVEPRAAGEEAAASILARHRREGAAPVPEEIVDRLFLPMLVEATRALEEGIARDPADVDLAVILGLGFPASRGGILGWCDTEGAAQILERLARFEALGTWFQPTAMLRRMAERGETFRGRGRPKSAIAQDGNSPAERPGAAG
jgi:3-hydroxyacyl-CoA dehydrogenase/enoyl-CoA hydratase/3-hydroxybutyryl-CoA epimerase/3-hydroxyacyl-CoA dehydrogenase/enoyl-CoA hydratase/3-hydroxybutyryl-CoA epimerase/enoyl-CoA isomerase